MEAGKHPGGESASTLVLTLAVATAARTRRMLNKSGPRRACGAADHHNGGDGEGSKGGGAARATCARAFGAAVAATTTGAARLPSRPPAARAKREANGANGASELARDSGAARTRASRPPRAAARRSERGGELARGLAAAKPLTHILYEGDRRLESRRERGERVGTQHERSEALRASRVALRAREPRDEVARRSGPMTMRRFLLCMLAGGGVSASCAAQRPARRARLR